MDWTMVAAVAEMGGAVAVVFSLIYVGRQVRQNTAAVRSQAYQSLSQSVFDLTIEATRPSLVSVLVKGAGDAAAPLVAIGAEFGLDPDEAGQIFGYFRASLHSMENRFRQIELGILDQSAFEQFGGKAVYYRWPVFRAFWPLLRDMLENDFAEFFEQYVGIGAHDPEQQAIKAISVQL